MKRQEMKKQGGFTLSSELVLLTTVLVIGMTVGLVSMRDAITAEMHDTAEAIGSIDQSFAFDGMINSQGTAEVAGTEWTDAVDSNAGDDTGWIFVAPELTEDNSIIGTAADASAATATTTDGTLN